MRHPQVPDAEQFRPLSHFARPLGCHPCTLGRKVMVGDKTPIGRIKLRAVRFGSKWLTTQAAVDEYLAAVTAAHLGTADASTSVDAIRTPTARKRASEAAARELEKLGC
jgi:hypothetical protein